MMASKKSKGDRSLIRFRLITFLLLEMLNMLYKRKLLSVPKSTILVINKFSVSLTLVEIFHLY